jgi:hypothetical protein
LIFRCTSELCFKGAKRRSFALLRLRSARADVQRPAPLKQAPDLHADRGMSAGRYWRREVALLLGEHGKWLDRVADALGSSGVKTRRARTARDAEASFDHGVTVVVAEGPIVDGNSEEAQFLKTATARCPVVLVRPDDTKPERVTRLVLEVLA